MGILGRRTGDKAAIRHGKCARETCTNSALERSDREGRWLKGPLARLRRWVATTKDAGWNTPHDNHLTIVRTFNKERTKITMKNYTKMDAPECPFSSFWNEIRMRNLLRSFFMALFDIGHKLFHFIGMQSEFTVQQSKRVTFTCIKNRERRASQERLKGASRA